MDTSNTLSQVKVAPTVSKPAGAPSSAPSQVKNENVAANFADMKKSVQKSTESIEENRKSLDRALTELKRVATDSGRSLGFDYDNSLKQAIVTVTDLETGKVVRKIPQEVVIRVAHSIEMMKGLLFDKKL